VIAMREVQTRAVHPCLDECLDLLLRVARGAERTDDLSAPHVPVVTAFCDRANLAVSVPGRLPVAQLGRETQTNDESRVKGPLCAIRSRLRVPISWVGVHVTGRDS